MTRLADVCPDERSEVQVDPVVSAHAAGLRYMTDAAPGIRRRRAGRGFAYWGPDGKLIRDPETLQRIRSLAIPPAWTEVWIAADPESHIQATGRDARGRKQYRYHPRWQLVRNTSKYDRMVAFGEALPRIRERVDQDLEQRGLPRAKVLAMVVRLLEETFIRVGNEAYRRQNHSFGLTTLRNRHVEVIGATMRFRFRGKSGRQHDVRVHDRRLARLIKRLQELPGQELFQYVNEAGERHTIESADVNAYLREISGADFTAKDFRTWAGTVLAARFLRQAEPPGSATQARQMVVAAVKQVAERLGNTPSVCRKCYIHPTVIEAYQAGALTAAAPAERVEHDDAPYSLSAEEEALLALLRAGAAREMASASATPPESGTTRAA